MHRVLQIEDLVHLICVHARRADLPTLALLQKRLGGFALDFLWKTIPLKALLYLFPADAVGRDLTPGSIEASFVRPLVGGDWVRFNLYAPRIQTLRRYEEPRDTFINVNNILHFLILCRPQLILFPNLLRLEWNNSSHDEFISLPVFFTPSLFSVEISAPRRIQNSGTIMTATGLYESLLWHLGDLGKQLREIDVPIPHITLPMGYEAPWILLLNNCSNLVEVSLPSSPLFLHLVSTLPNLRSLTLRIRMWETARDSLPDNDSGEAPRSLFPVLEALTVMDAKSLRDVTEILTGANCFPRKIIQIFCVESPTPAEISALLKVMLHPSISYGLQEFCLVASHRTETPTNSPVASVISAFGVSVAESTTPLTRDALHPLLRCHYLNHFVFDTASVISLNDEDLYHISVAWPLISTLKLGNAGIGHSEGIHRISLHGLNHLVYTQLSSLSLTLDINENILDEIQSLPDLTAIPSCPLNMLDVRSSSHMTSPQSGRLVTKVASFLLPRFPLLRSIRGEDPIWAEIEDSMRTIRGLLGHVPPSYWQSLA